MTSRASPSSSAILPVSCPILCQFHAAEFGESDHPVRLNPTTQFGVSEHLGEGLAAA